MSQMSISGAFSGLDTATIINQLMSVESAQQQMVKTRQTAAQKTADAYGKLITSLKDLATKAKKVSDTSEWSFATASSSSTTVTATATGTRSASLTFDVTSVARAHSLVSEETATSTQQAVAQSSLTLSRAGEDDVTIDVGTGTLADVVNGINAADVGLHAAAVQTSPGEYRLQVTAAETGASSQFELAGLETFSAMSVLAEGSDAEITVGSLETTQYSVTSTTNTFDSVVDGLSFTVRAEEENVTVSATVDGGGVADQISSLVDSANSVLSDIAAQTTWNTTTKTGGALFGESAVRQVQQNVLSVVGNSQAAGISLTRDGKLSFNREEFLTAFAADPRAVADGFGGTMEFDPSTGVEGTVQMVRQPTTRRAGSYALQVAVAAAREQWRLEPPGGDISGRTVVIMRGSMILTYTAGAGETIANALAAINRRTAEMGLGVNASTSNGSIVLSAINAGSAAAFTASIDTGTSVRTVTAQDVDASLVSAGGTSSGSVLTIDDSEHETFGMALDIDVSEADIARTGGNVGYVNYAPGLAGELATMIEDLTRSQTGTLVTAQQGRTEDVKDLQDQMAAWDRRLEARRISLTRQFTSMETLIASLQSQTSALSGLSSFNYSSTKES